MNNRGGQGAFDRTMTVLVTGGAGFLGKHLVRHLLDEGHTVQVLDLEPFEDDRFDGEDVTFLRGDVADPDVVDRACRNVDAVVHAAAALPIQDEDRIVHTDYEGTCVVLEAACSAGVDRFVYISTTAVYGIPDLHPIPEDFEGTPVGPYGRAKWRAEQACRSYRDEMFVSILRPKTFVGEERLGIMEVLFDWIRRGKNIYVLGDGTNRYQLLDVHDLCRAILLALTHPDADDTFNVGATRFGTINEDMQPVLEEAGTGARLVHLPAAPIQAVLRLLEWLNLSPIVRWQYDTMNVESCVDTRKIRRVLGWEPRRSNQETLLENFRWYMNHYRDLPDTGGETHRVPWDQKLLKWVRYFS